MREKAVQKSLRKPLAGADNEIGSLAAATGNVSGAWFTGREISRDPGMLPSIWVDDIDETLALAAAHGGIVVESRRPDSPGSTSSIATFRDLIGLYQEGSR